MILKNNSAKKSKTILFDFDGTLADTFDLGIDIYNQVAEKFCCKKIELELKEQLRYKSPQEFFKDYKINRFKLLPLLFYVKKRLHKEFHKVQPIPGVTDVLKEFHKQGFDLGIVTSNSKRNVKSFLELNQLTNIFKFTYSTSTLFKKDKVILRLIKKYRLSQQSVVYIGDETRDIEAAKKSGIPIISVSWGFHAKEKLKTLAPDIIVDSPEDLIGVLENLNYNLNNGL